MKIIAVREIIQPDGSKTTITVEEDMNNPAVAQIKEYLETVGFYEPRTIGGKIMRFLSGGR